MTAQKAVKARGGFLQLDEDVIWDGTRRSVIFLFADAHDNRNVIAEKLGQRLSANSTTASSISQHVNDAGIIPASKAHAAPMRFAALVLYLRPAI